MMLQHVEPFLGSSEHIAVILNVCPQSWELIEAYSKGNIPTSNPSSIPSAIVTPGRQSIAKLPLQFEYCWQAIISFLSTLSIGWNHSRIIFIIYHGSDAHVLLESSGQQHSYILPELTSSLSQFIHLESSLQGEPMLFLALSQALFRLNKKKDEHFSPDIVKPTTSFTLDSHRHNGSNTSISSATKLSLKRQQHYIGHRIEEASRIILIDPGVDSYVQQTSALLRSAFASEHEGVVIDVCCLGYDVSAAIYQLAKITGGIYLNLSTSILERAKEEGYKNVPKFFREGESDPILASKYTAQIIAEFLWFHYTTPLRARERIPLAMQYSTVATSTVCQCHQRPVEIALVCSCCLTIFCMDYRAPICSACRARFKRDREITVASAKVPTTLSHTHTSVLPTSTVVTNTSLKVGECEQLLVSELPNLDQQNNNNVNSISSHVIEKS